MTSIESLRHTLALLKREKEEDLEQYKQKILRTPLQERKKAGLSWYPVIFKRTMYGTGEKIIIELERTAEIDKPHVFQSGKLVSIFAQSHNGKVSEEQISGVVNQVRGNSMLITLNADHFPDWIDYGKLGIDLLFDEASYREMESALKQVIEAKGRSLELREKILGMKALEFDSLKPFSSPQLNESQQNAVRHIVAARDVAIVHGPPGTGKTTTLVKAITKVLEGEEQVLVCAPSNAAVDLLVEKLTEAGHNVVRLGHPARVTEDALQQTIDVRIANHPTYADLKKAKQKREEFRKLAFKYKRNFGYAERNQRKLLLREASALQAEAEMLEHYIIEDIMGKAQVIATTLVGSASPYLHRKRFTTLFIDEAAQALEPACWIPILRSDRVVFAGDHCQLPPTIKSLQAAREGLSKTLFEKVIEAKAIGSLLTVQYRMNKQIMGFSNKQFYRGALIADKQVENHQLTPEEVPFEFVDTAGCGYGEEINPESLSRYNQEEARFMLSHLENLVKRVGISTQENSFSIGVIAPYKAQILLLSDMLHNFPSLKNIGDLVTVDTIDAFQGRERDIIYISLVRSNDKGEIGFLEDVRRINVAMTRARKKLVIIGDSATLGHHPFYNDLIDYVIASNAYRSAFEYAF